MIPRLAPGLFLILFILASTTLASDNPCDEIDSLAEDWIALADFAEETHEKGANERETRELGAAIGKTIAQTRAWADALPSEQSEEASRLGALLSRKLRVLAATQDTSDAIVLMDAIIELLDSLVADCDEATRARSEAPE